MRKNSSLSIEGRRLQFLLIGTLFTTSMVLAALYYKKSLDPRVEKNEVSFLESNEVEFVEKKITEPPKEEPQTVVFTPPPSENDTVTENKNIVVKTNITLPPPDFKPDSLPKIVTKEKLIEFPDVEASFPGGFEEMTKYLQSNIQYPELSMDMGEQGKVYVSFIVDVKGNISNVKIDKSVSDLLDKEAKRVVRLMPNWTPGEKDGEKVKTLVSLPILFKIK